MWMYKSLNRLKIWKVVRARLIVVVNIWRGSFHFASTFALNFWRIHTWGDNTMHCRNSHYSHMYSSTLHDPIFPHVQFHWEYALGCIATCTVPATMHDPIFPHVQFQQEYELASHGSCAVDSLSWGGTESWFFLCSLHTAYIHTIELNRGTYPHTLLGKKYQHSF